MTVAYKKFKRSWKITKVVTRLASSCFCHTNSYYGITHTVAYAAIATSTLTATMQAFLNPCQVKEKAFSVQILYVKKGWCSVYIEACNRKCKGFS